MTKDLDFLDIVETYSNLDMVSYQYFHQLFNHRTVLFNQEVDDSIIETVYLPLKEFEEDSSNDPITLILNSPGGTVSDGFFIAHYLTHYKKKLNIIVTGYAASMAAVILAAGGKNPNITRKCYPSSYALIHDGFIAISPSESKTAADIMAFNDKVDNDIRQFILDNTNIQPDLYDAQARHQWFINSKEMLEFNLIDEIIEQDSEE